MKTFNSHTTSMICVCLGMALNGMALQAQPAETILFQDGFENSQAGGRAVDTPPFSTLEIPETQSMGSAFTLAAHVNNSEEPPDFTRIFTSYRGTGAVETDRLILDMDASGNTIPGLRAIINNTVVQTASPPEGMSDPGYHHYAVTYDNGTVTIYFDGQMVVSDSVGGGSIEMTQNLFIGEDPHDGGGGANEQLMGHVDNVLVITRLLGEEEIADLAAQSVQDVVTPNAGERAVWYDFEGDSGTTVTDKFTEDGAQDGIATLTVSVDTNGDEARLGTGSLRIQSPNATAGQPPAEDDADVGTYASGSSFVQVLNVALEEGPDAAHDGENYLMIDRLNSGGGPNLSALFEGGGFPANSMELDIEYYLWTPGNSNNIAVLALGNGTGFSPDTQLFWNGIGRFDAWDEAGWDFNGWRFFQDGAWQGPGPEIPTNEWTQINIHWDGLTATRSVNDGEPMPLGRWGSPANTVDRLFLSTAIGNTIYFVDDILVTATPIPTPPALATSGQEDPASSGFTLDTDGSPTVGAGNDGVDHWQIQAGADIRANYQVALTEDQIQNPQGWTATIEGKIVGMGDSLGDVEISVTDDQDTWALRLSAGTGSLPAAGAYWVTPQGEERIGSELNTIDPTQYHVYQLIYNPGGNGNQGTVEVYVDGVLRTTRPITREEVPDAGGTAPRFLFGDNDAGSGGASETRWALARFENGSHPIERESLAPGEQLFVFKETFEDGAVESAPDAPQLGSYGAGGDPALITDAADPGAQEGAQYLLINRFTDPRGDFAMPVFSVPALAEKRDRVHAEAYWLWVSGLPQFTLQVEGAPRYQVTLWGSDQNHRVTVYDGSQHVETGLAHTPGNWSKYEFDYVVGSDQITLTVDGESATVTVPPLDRVDGMQFRSGGGNTEAYVDNSSAYLTSVPEAILVQSSGQSDPAESGFTLETDGAPTVSPGEEGEPHWAIQVPEANRAHYRLSLEDSGVAQDPRGWTATARGRILSMGDALGDAEISVNDGLDIWTIRLSLGTGSLPEAGVYLATNSGETRIDDPSNPIDPSAYHTYQIIFDPLGDGGNGAVRIFVDGVNLTTPAVTRAEVPDANGESPGFLLGDNESTSGGASESHWSEIAFQTGQHPAPPVVLFEHDFENSPLAGPPLDDDPQAGRYTSSSFFVEVLSGPFEDGPDAAAEGEKYLTIDRINSGGTPSLNAFFEGGGFPANTLGLDIQFQFWSSGSANNIAAIGLSNGTSFSGDTHLLWNGIGRFDAWDAEGWEFLGWRFYDGAWNGPGPEINEREWTRINIHWDGSQATGRVNDGEPFDLGLFGNPEQEVDRLFFTTAVADTIYFVDDIRVSSFRLSAPSGPVELTHEVDGNQLTLSWDAEGFTLQQNPDVTDPAGWTDVPDGGTSPITVPLDQPMNYFRLISR